MNIKYINGDLFSSSAEALVNPVNTQGVMGQGVALEMKKRFPGILAPYVAACREQRINIGAVQLIQRESQPKYIINFPTKQNWKNFSKLSYIEDGLKDLVIKLDKHKIKSVAMPALGCGLGGLAWESVHGAIEETLGSISGNTSIEVYLDDDMYAKHSLLTSVTTKDTESLHVKLF